MESLGGDSSCIGDDVHSNYCPECIAAYINAALTTRRNYLDANFRSKLSLDSSEAVTAWFVGKGPL
jgi:hypothetical protein